MAQVTSIADLNIWGETEPPVITPVSKRAIGILGSEPFIPIGDFMKLFEMLPESFIIHQTDHEPVKPVTLMFLDRVLQ